jgi:hypothetical protein
MSKLPSFGADMESSYEQLNNYSPQGCDMVALYPFANQAYTIPAAARIQAKTDWSMDKAVWPCGPTKCTLLNFYRYALRKRGWSPATPLIGVPQAFGYNVTGAYKGRLIWPEPTSPQLTREMAGFCKGGVEAILAFEWHPHIPGISSALTDKTLRTGLAKGARACHKIWSHHTGPAFKKIVVPIHPHVSNPHASP